MKNINAKCTLFNEIENSKHLNFDCVNIEQIWKAASQCLILILNGKMLWGHRSPNYIIIFVIYCI